MKQVKHVWPFWRRARLVTDRTARQAFRLFRTFPAFDYRVLVDLGAYRGAFTEAARRVLAPEHVVLVEADPESAVALEARYATDPGCVVVNAAVTDETGKVELRINAHRDSTSILPIAKVAERIFQQRMTEERTVEVPGISLDDLFDRYGLTDVALLKVDIQGAERQMIEGGKRALASVRAIFIEVCFEEFYTGSADFTELDQMLQARGFKLRSFHGSRLGSDGCLAYTNALYLRLS